MSNFCRNDNKFVSLEIQEPEVESIEVNDDALVTAEVRVTETCSECGEEMKEYIFSLENGADDDLTLHIEEHTTKLEDYSLSVVEDSVEYTERYYPRVKKNGKPVPHRYQKHYIGVKLSYQVECSCGKSFDGAFEDDVQASAFEDLQ